MPIKTSLNKGRRDLAGKDYYNREERELLHQGELFGCEISKHLQGQAEKASLLQGGVNKART